ncbi:MAG: YciI family protein [Aquabacterium sp.]|uniref:YciI family protein n=1 Tax=Aquabacterium sp. TaxID=1872578 RepID=UPI002727A6C0|nr:YciI family protein [Aquabacterium sp.]MDO9004483.1 YciI family protein [Aquabacterium sp.]
MRFMIMVKARPQSEAGGMPDKALTASMTEYHEQLAQAGVLLDASGLQPTAMGWRVHFGAQGQRQVVDGPFTEGQDLVAGYTLIQVRSREEAVEWTQRFPAPMGPGWNAEIEARQLHEPGGFGPSIQP